MNPEIHSMIGKEYHEYKYKTYHKLYHSTDQCCCTGMHRPVYKISCCRTLKRPAGLCTDQKYIPIRISRKQRSCIRDTAKPESFLLHQCTPVSTASVSLVYIL